MAARRLFENLEVDWERLSLPGEGREDLPREADAPARSLGFIRAQDLRSVRCLLSLHRRAVTLGLLKDSEAGRLAFLATAAYCLRMGERPAALLAHLIRTGKLPATLHDEDRASSALKRYLARKRGPAGWLKQRVPEKPERE